MTIDAFARAENVIRAPAEGLQDEKPIHLIQAVRPVLILDEPQNMESENRVRALAALDPLFSYPLQRHAPQSLQHDLSSHPARRLPARAGEADRSGVRHRRR